MSENSVAKGIFLECLEPYILSDKLMGITAQVMKDLLLHFQDKNRLENMEACIVHMDITSLDIQQVCLPDWTLHQVPLNKWQHPLITHADFFSVQHSLWKAGSHLSTDRNYLVQTNGAFWPLICNRTLLCVLAGGPSVLGKPSLWCHDLCLQQWNEWLHQSHGGRRDAHLFICWACSLCEKWHFRLIHNLLIQYICSVLFHSEGDIIYDMQLFDYMHLKSDL